MSASLVSCIAPPVDVNSMVREWQNYMQSDYILRPNDQIAVSVHPEGVTQTLAVPPTGSLNLARIEKPIVAVGRPMRVFRAEVQQKYRQIYADDVIVQVSLASAATNSVYVAGEVRSPGPKAYERNMTLTQVIAASGGFDYRAKLTDVRIIRQMPDGKPKTYRINVNDLYHDTGFPDFLVLPGDVIYCQSNWAGELADALNLYLWSLLPFNNSAARVVGFY